MPIELLTDKAAPIQTLGRSRGVGHPSIVARRPPPGVKPFYLSKTMGNLAHDVGQRSHQAGADPEISSRRSLKSSRSHQKAEYKTKSDNRQCGDNETGDNGGKHVSSNISSSLVECCWNARIQTGTKTETDLLFGYP